ncbi:unnamed protein product [Moneuplotes crassus]|uniref:Uncharacterized protein n=1 Tax=Euplotes crassus TaxID=5936 RepID=A0AAD1XAS2_EUPCR|nr:unnamed protein product [Moneuplotes crassus]
MARSPSKSKCKILSLIQPKLFQANNGIMPTIDGKFNKIRRSMHIKSKCGGERRQDLWFPKTDAVNPDKSVIYSAIFNGRRSRFRKLQKSTESEISRRNKSMLNKYDNYKDSYIGNPDEKMTNDFSQESLKRSLEKVNSFMQNHDCSSPIGPANIKKSAIVQRSKTKELSNHVPKRSQIKVRSVLDRWKHQDKLTSQGSVSDISPANAYNLRSSMSKSIRDEKIASQKGSTIAYKDTMDRYLQEQSADLYRDISSKTYETPSMFDPYPNKNPSTLDKYFRLDLGKKHLNILASKNHKRENSLNNLNRIELPKDPSLAEPIFDKSSPEKSDEVEWKKDQIVHKYKTKLAHEKLMKKTQQKAKINIKGKTDLKKNIYKEPDSPTLSTVHKNLIEEQKRLEEADTWNQQRRKRKKNPLIDLTEKLDKVLKEPFKKDKAWIRFNDHYKVANQYHG